MDFRKLLFDVGRALRTEEVKALAFLCTDLLARNPASVEMASDLFSRLVDQDHLSPEQPHLLTELLLIIQRPGLARELRLIDQTPRSLISPYRTLLYNLSEEITTEDLRDVKFLLNSKLPRRKLEENVTTLEVFLEMEHMDLISNTNLNLLESIFDRVCPVLNEKIRQFKAQQVLHTRPIAQETGRPRAMTCPPNQDPQSLDPERTASREMPAFLPLAECSMTSSNTSMDFPNVSCGGNESGALPQGLSLLSIETSRRVSLTVGSDASPEEQTSQTTNTNTEGLRPYPMTAAKRGICLIINNYNFDKLLKREGTMVDQQCLHKVFEWLGFDVEIHMDCDSCKMLSVFQDLGRRDHSQMDCVVCCVLSHGNEGSVYGVDGKTVLLKDLKDLVKCPSLAEKPKLFFIQACQGTREQKPVYIEADGPTDGVVYTDAHVVARESIPSDADFLVGMATVSSFVSFRERSKGTWFIQSLCRNLVEMVPRGCDLVSILTIVNADVSRKSDSSGLKKQMPQPAFTLRKKVVFPNPRAPPPSLSQ